MATFNSRSASTIVEKNTEMKKIEFLITNFMLLLFFDDNEIKMARKPGKKQIRSDALSKVKDEKEI